MMLAGVPVLADAVAELADPARATGADEVADRLELPSTIAWRLGQTSRLSPQRHAESDERGEKEREAGEQGEKGYVRSEQEQVASEHQESADGSGPADPARIHTSGQDRRRERGEVQPEGQERREEQVVRQVVAASKEARYDCLAPPEASAQLSANSFMFAPPTTAADPSAPMSTRKGCPRRAQSRPAPSAKVRETTVSPPTVSSTPIKSTTRSATKNPLSATTRTASPGSPLKSGSNTVATSWPSAPATAATAPTRKIL